MHGIEAVGVNNGIVAVNHCSKTVMSAVDNYCDKKFALF